MEHPSDPRNISRDQKIIGAAERNVPHRARQGTKLRDMLMSDKPKLSYADFHHEITKDPSDTIPRLIGSQQSQLLEGVTPKEDELVRYMSNLPSYLEKGKDFPEKALNLGVLDWKRLEKWRYCQKQVAHKHNGYSPSSSNASLFSTDDLSTNSSRGQSCSPAHQKMHRCSLHSSRETSPKERHVQDAKSSSSKGYSCSPAHHRMQNAVLQSHPQKVYAGVGKSREIDVFGGNPGKSEDLPVGTGNHLSRQQKVLGALQRCERKECDMKSAYEMGQRLGFDKYDLAAPWKGKTKIQGGECTKQTLKSPETKVEADNGDLFKGEKSRVLICPANQSENSSLTPSAPAVLSVEADGNTFSGKNDHEKSLPCKIVDKMDPEPNGSCSQNPESATKSSHASQMLLHSTKMFHSPSRFSVHGVKGSSQASNMLSFPSRMLSSPSRSRKTEELDVRKTSESIPKTRNPSPIRRLSFAMGKMIKNAGSRDNSPLRKSSSKDCVTKSGSERDSSSFSMDNPCSDTSLSNNNRGRSSPLRRLLDPLLKSQASNSSVSSKKHSSITVGTRKTCNNQSDFCAEHSVKNKSRPASGSTLSASDSLHISKNGSLSLQALLQVSFKNGLPLFTFAIDNESDILAATVRKSFAPGKGHHNWTYTFFTVREIKRKSGIWLNHGGKGDGHGYVPNVVAQMKVSDSQDCPFTKHENADDYITREFDLFAVDVGHGDHYATDFHPTNELAAIVVILPRTSEDFSKDGQSSYSWLDFSPAFTGSDTDLQNHHSIGRLNLSTTVILPGGVHTVPSKGEISTLAQRWRSGGSCDCGGWDLGCQLRVCTNPREPCPRMDKFQLFPQVGQENQPILSLAPFKERIYSVEFNSSLSLLQAFAVCISLVDCRRPAEISEPNNIAEKITSEIGVLEVPMPMKASNHQVGAPARYVSYPPHSPVGRV